MPMTAPRQTLQRPPLGAVRLVPRLVRSRWLTGARCRLVGQPARSAGKRPGLPPYKLDTSVQHVFLSHHIPPLSGDVTMEVLRRLSPRTT